MTPPPLSPTAQAVLDAWSEVTGWGGNPPPVELSALAAAIRALVEATLPEDLHRCETYTNELIRLNRMGICAQQLAIAAELDGTANTTEDQ
jgi:hypothetical protein